MNLENLQYVTPKLLRLSVKNSDASAIKLN